MTCSLHVLTTGYVGGRVASTVTLLREGDILVVVDPGMVADRQLILGPLAPLNVTPDQVTDVVFSHHHPDHTLNAALFPNARYHDHWAVYHRDIWEDRSADGVQLSASIQLATTPGHSAEDISTLAWTDEGLVVLTHLWWTERGPADDPYAPDRDQLTRSREKVLTLRPTLVIPGHGPGFTPGPDTPV